MRISITVLAIILGSSAVQAEPESICLERWKAADLDANGAFDAATDSKDYAAVLITTAQVSRDEFLKMCASDRFAAMNRPENPAANRNFGKGDLTKGPPLAKDVAMKKLKAAGYGDVGELTLDEQGIWHGKAVTNGKSVDVAVDHQGDIVSR